MAYHRTISRTIKTLTEHRQSLQRFFTSRSYVLWPAAVYRTQPGATFEGPLVLDWALVEIPEPRAGSSNMPYRYSDKKQDVELSFTSIGDPSQLSGYAKAGRSTGSMVWDCGWATVRGI
ncbi:uncharacterized protein N7483_008176 [Penicillium malachiteum]|uniref:uncharacterized protein n=1 Tax=Penicillium malachiteum TaxID=1324776 RepID=UPI002547E45B|nr:uncharacterized protein N7483_008176 [Penicillium malachiteum]KAJ5720242.1 hypothetical protein N7483_008176 [Penicillium malachiteum]